MQTANLKTQKITQLIRKLTEEDQEKLYQALKLQVLLAQAKSLDAKVKKLNFSISMDEIVAVVSEVRQVRYHA